MNLKLKFPPTPEFAEKLAEVAVSTVQRVQEVTLDYSPASLQFVDLIIQGFRDEGLKQDQIAETLFVFGCYAGEILVREHQAVWAHSQDVMPEKVAPLFSFMVVKMPNGKVWNPIGKAFKELENGQEDSLAYMFNVATAP